MVEWASIIDIVPLHQQLHGKLFLSLVLSSYLCIQPQAHPTRPFGSSAPPLSLSMPSWGIHLLRFKHPIPWKWTFSVWGTKLLPCTFTWYSLAADMFGCLLFHLMFLIRDKIPLSLELSPKSPLHEEFPWQWTGQAQTCAPKQIISLTLSIPLGLTLLYNRAGRRGLSHSCVSR